MLASTQPFVCPMDYTPLRPNPQGTALVADSGAKFSTEAGVPRSCESGYAEKPKPARRSPRRRCDRPRATVRPQYPSAVEFLAFSPFPARSINGR